MMQVQVQDRGMQKRAVGKRRAAAASSSWKRGGKKRTKNKAEQVGLRIEMRNQ